MDRRFLRPGWLVGHLLVVVAVLVCLRLGWWQWDRTREATGTAQNFGYAVLWPCFGVAFVYMWVRFLQLEHVRDREDAETFDQGLTEILDSSDSAGDEGQPGSADPAGGPDGTVPVNNATDVPEEPAPRIDPREAPSRAIPLSVATVGDDDENDPELAAYNRALAALAEKDNRRAP